MVSAIDSTETKSRLTRAAAAVAACLIAFAFAIAIAPNTAFASSPEVINSEPQNDAVSVPTEGTLWIQFENNVVTNPDNASLVTLETEDGQVVSSELFNVTLPDAQTDVEHRDYIMVNVNGLENGKVYVIHVAPGIASKNGNVSDSETFIKFTTAAAGESSAELSDATAIAAGEKSKGNGAGDGSGNGKNEGASASDANSSASSSASADSTDKSSASNESSAASNTKSMTNAMSPAFAIVMAAFWIAALASAIYFVRVSKPEKTCTK